MNIENENWMLDEKVVNAQLCGQNCVIKHYDLMVDQIPFAKCTSDLLAIVYDVVYEFHLSSLLALKTPAIEEIIHFSSSKFFPYIIISLHKYIVILHSYSSFRR